MLADAIYLIPHRNICILISSLAGRRRNKGPMRRPSDINYTVCSLLISSSGGLRSAAVCFLYKHGCSRHLLLWYSVCCASLVLLSLAMLFYVLCSASHSTPSSPPPASSSSLSLSTLCRYLCFGICASLLHSVSSHPPSHTHTHSLSLYCGQSTCAQKHLRQLFFFFILGSHLAALYSNYPRRGLTAGNINRVARSYIEHTLMHERRAHTCKATTLIAVAEAVQPCQPPFLKIHYCC